MSTVKPNGFILLQDRLLDGNLLAGTYGGTPDLPSQAGPHAGPATPDTDNSGNLMPFCFSEWSEESTDAKPNPEAIQYQVVVAGGLFGTAEWTWNFESDATDQWRGMNDHRHFSHVHSPFGDTASPDATECYHICIIYSRAFNRVLLFKNSAGLAGFKVAIRSVSAANPTSWTSSYWPTATALSGYRNFDTAKEPSGRCRYSTGWENPDGSLRFLYPYAPTDTTGPDYITFDIWGSNDGGDTWEVLVEDVCTKYFGGYRYIEFINSDVSGDWVRLSMYVRDTTTDGLITAVSADGGATWKIITKEPDGLDTTSSDTAAKYEVSGICGLGTSDGMFLRVRGSTGNDLLYETASRDSDWTHITLNPLFYQAIKGVKAVYVGRGSAYVHILAISSDVDLAAGEEVCGYDGRVSYLIPLNAINDPRLTSGESTGAWLSRGAITDGSPATGVAVHSGFMNQGYTAYRPKNGANAFRWVGDCMMLAHTTYSHKSTATDYDDDDSYAGIVATYCMQYSRRPIRSRLYGSSDDITNCFWIPYEAVDGTVFGAEEDCNQWRVEWGGPTAAAVGATSATNWTPASSYWTRRLSGVGGANSWQADRYEIQTGPGLSNYYYLDRSYAATPAPPAGYGLGDRSLIAWTMKIDSTSAATLPGGPNQGRSKIGVFVGDVYTFGAGGTFQISVALTTTEAAVYDVAAGSTLYHATGKDFTQWTEFRLGIGYQDYVGISTAGDKVFANFGYCTVGGDTAWTNSGLLTVDSTSLAPVTDQWLQIGMGTGGANTVGTGSGSPDNKIYLKNIIVARGESLANLYYENPWTLRGVPASTNQRHVAQGIYSSWGGGAGYKGDEFEMDVQYQYGANQLNSHSPQSVWRSNDGAAQDLTFDATTNNDNNQFKHSGVALIGSNMRKVRVEYDVNTTFPSPSGITLDATLYTALVQSGAISSDGISVQTGENSWKDHELAGKYVEWDVGTGATNQLFKISDNHDRNIYMAGMTQLMASFGISTGDTIHIYGDRMMGIFPTETQAAMRLRVAAGKPQDDYWQIGRLVAGHTLPLTVPMVWDHTDTEAGNYDLTTNLSGTRQSYQRGLARRTIQGNVEGDADSYRRSFRATMREITEYGNRPIVLCQDDGAMSAQMIYCRFVDDTALDNAGWKYDSDLGRWIRVGDMAVTFEEEI